jgi:hypothetical protein
MKKLELNQMENLLGGREGAYCALIGFLFIPGMASGMNNSFWTVNATACWNS